MPTKGATKELQQGDHIRVVGKVASCAHGVFSRPYSGNEQWSDGPYAWYFCNRMHEHIAPLKNMRRV